MTKSGAMIRLMCLLLALTLALTSQSMAVMHGQAVGVGVAQYCLNGQIRTVIVDEDGTPVPARHSCPECALTFLPDVDAPHAVSPRAICSVQPRTIVVSSHPLAAIALAPPARAPPLVV